MQKRLQLFGRARLLHLPDRLSQCVGTTPRTNPDGALILLVSQTDNQFATLAVVVAANHLDASPLTTHHTPATNVLHTWPVAHLLTTVLFL